MGNVCLTKTKSIQLETEGNKKVENEKEKKIILAYLLEKCYLLRTEESKTRINSELKESFMEYDSEPETAISKESQYENDKFIKAMQYYEKLFELININSFGLCRPDNYNSLSKEIVINYYGYILLRDRCCTDR